MDYTKEQILERFKKLPEDIREAMFSVDTAMVIQDIRQKYKFTIDKMGELADETGLVMLGFTHPKDYISHLTERLAVSRETAKEIAEEINSRVFYSVREQLKKIHGLGAETYAKDRPLEIPKAGPWQGRSLPQPQEPQPGFGSASEVPQGRQRPTFLQGSPRTGLSADPRPVLKEPAETKPAQNIFEARTKEEIFRAPRTVSEKIEPPKFPAKLDPYKEQI